VECRYELKKPFSTIRALSFAKRSLDSMKRALYSMKRDLHDSGITSLINSGVPVCTKRALPLPYLLPKEPYLLPKEPYLLPKETCVP